LHFYDVLWRPLDASAIFPLQCDSRVRVRGEFLDLSGARLYYYAAGTRGAGVPAVFIHGFPTSSHLWNELIPLIPPGHRLVVLDLLGYGRSDRPGARRVDAQAHAERVVELFDELRIQRACIVGHGIGGGIAQLIATQFATRVSHVCLVNSVGLDCWPSVASRTGRACAPFARFLPPAVMRRVLRGGVVRGYSDPERANRSIDLYLRPFDGPEGRDAAAAHIKALAGTDTSALASRLGAIAAPTAIVCGQQDRAVPPSVARGLHEAIPNSTLDVIAGARHFTPEEAPQQVADAIERLLRR
jgi:pimeloyl-ACP methyl ester carboxylesterase